MLRSRRWYRIEVAGSRAGSARHSVPARRTERTAAKANGIRQLPSADARNHVDAEFLGGVHGGPPDASQRPGHDKRLAALRPSRQPHELITRQRYERYGCGIDQVQPVRYMGENGAFNRYKLSIGLPG